MSNRKQLLPLLAIILISTFAFSCKKSSNSTNGADIYLAGNTVGGFPAYWKNGAITQLSSTTQGEAYSIFVSGNDVYTGGWLRKPSLSDTTIIARCPILWKNNTPIIVSDTSGAIFDVKVVNGSVYASGFFEDTFSKRGFPVYWKDGMLNFLQTLPSTLEGKGFSIFVDNNDVYVGGYMETQYGYNPFIWKNGSIIYADTNKESYLYSVYVSGNDVYAAGIESGIFNSDKPLLLKNGVKTALTNNYGFANNVFVNGSDVYVTGYTNDSGVNSSKVARVWKNGAFYQYPNTTNNSSAFISTIFKNDFYTLVFDLTQGTIVWKNGTAVYTLNNFLANGMFIK